MTTGCSMGAYHALNFFLQHPDVFTKVIALSGVYDARFFVGDYYNDDAIYQNSPVDYIWNQNDGWFIDRYRQAEIVLCTGLGAWEQDGLPSFTSSKKPLTRNKFQPGLLNGDMMSPTTGNGGVNKCLISSVISIYKGVTYELPCYFSLLSTKLSTVYHRTS